MAAAQRRSGFIPATVVVAREQGLRESARLTVGATRAQAETVVGYAQGQARAEVSLVRDEQQAQIQALQSEARAYAQSVSLDAYQTVVRTEELACSEVASLIQQRNRQQGQLQNVESAAQSEVAALRGAATGKLGASSIELKNEMNSFQQRLSEDWNAAVRKHQEQSSPLQLTARNLSCERDKANAASANLKTRFKVSEPSFRPPAMRPPLLDRSCRPDRPTHSAEGPLRT